MEKTKTKEGKMKPQEYSRMYIRHMLKTYILNFNRINQELGESSLEKKILVKNDAKNCKILRKL